MGNLHSNNKDKQLLYSHNNLRTRINIFNICHLILDFLDFLIVNLLEICLFSYLYNVILIIIVVVVIIIVVIIIITFIIIIIIINITFIIIVTNTKGY